MSILGLIEVSCGYLEDWEWLVLALQLKVCCSIIIMLIGTNISSFYSGSSWRCVDNRYSFFVFPFI